MLRDGLVTGPTRGPAGPGSRIADTEASVQQPRTVGGAPVSLGSLEQRFRSHGVPASTALCQPCPHPHPGSARSLSERCAGLPPLLKPLPAHHTGVSPRPAPAPPPSEEPDSPPFVPLGQGVGAALAGSPRPCPQRGLRSSPRRRGPLPCLRDLSLCAPAPQSAS